MAELHAPLGEVELAYDTAGERGSPVVLVMGLAGRGRAWRFQVPALAERHRVAWFDHRGVGQTRAPLGPLTTGAMAADVLGLMDHLGFEHAHVVGVSMGGMVAQEVALQAPSRVRSLSLIATHAGGRLPRVPTGRGVRGFLATLRRDTEARLAALERLLFPEEWVARCDRDALRATLRDDFGGATPRGRLAQLSAVLRHHTAPRLATLTDIPSLVVRPGRDLLVRPHESDRLIGLLPRARLLRLDDAGHGVIRQCAEPLNEALLEHLEAADRG